MRKSLLGFSIFLIFWAAGAFGQEQRPATAFEPATLGFEENKGQVRHLDSQYPHQVQFILKDKGVTLFFHKTGITYQLTSVEYVEDEGLSPMRAGKNRKQVKSVSTYRFDQLWEGASENTTLQAEEPLAGTSLYWVDQSQVGVTNYSKIIYRNIYPNIDIEYYIKDNRLKYDVVVKPGADVNQVQFHYEGGVEPALIDGKIRIETSLGFLEEQQPVTYSKSGRKLSSHYSRQDAHFGFTVPEGNQEQAFTIDPDLIWGTYYGGTLYDEANDIAVDASGNVFVGGATASSTAIASSGFQIGLGGATDAFLVKFNSSGVRQWATYYGGTGDDYATDVTLDATGNVYLSGYTTSTTGISAAGGHQTVLGGGNDAFIVKFNTSGSRLWATYYGGTTEDYAFAATCDASSNVILVGYSNSTNAIASGGHQLANGGIYDAFVVKFNSSGVRQFGTYYGGTDNEYGLGCAVDASGNIFLGGQTFSTTAISTAGSHQVSFSGGTNRDAFLVKFNSSGVRQWGTYYGGSGSDYLYATITDAAGNVIFSGDTDSGTAIASAGHQLTLLGTYDAFVVKFNTSGVRQWGTYYGNTGNDYAGVYKCITSDASSNIFLTGNTTSTTGIAAGGSINTLVGGADAYLVKFNASGVRQWGTYYGGILDENARAVVMDPTADFVYISGYTYSTGGIAQGGHQSTLAGDADGYLAKFRGTALPIPTITSFTPTSAASGASVTITGTNFSTTPANNIVYFGGARATVTGATATTLTVTVPVGATHRPVSVTINSLTAYSPQHFKPTFSGSGTIDATTLAAKVDFATGTYPDYVSLADADIDGKTDILVSNGNSATFSALRNVSTSGSITASSFSTKVDFTAATSPNSVEYGDLDGDGKLDMVVANATSNSISLYRNVSTPGAITTGSFSAKQDFIGSLSNPRNIAIRDFDGDGKPDIAVSNGNSANTVVFRNTTSTGGFTSGSLAAPVLFTAGTSPSGIATGDLDGDGKADLVISNSSSNTISVLRNTSVSGTISFATKIDFTTGTGPHNLAIADIDGDGKEDIIVPNSTAGTVSVIRNNSTVGTISLATKVDFTAGSNTIGIAVGDLNGDSKLDIVSTNTLSNNISVFRNTATSGSITTGSLAAKVDFTTGTAPSYGVAIGDLDGDGKPDVVVPNSGASANTVSVFRNASISATPEPTAQPTGFTPSAITTTTFTVSFTAAAGPPAGYIAVRKIGSAPTTDPTDGTALTVGAPLGDGTIAYVGSGVTFNETGLTASTQYFYKIYSYNGSGSGINYRQASPLPGNVTTSAPPPATANLALTSVTNSYTANLFAVRFTDAVTAYAVGTGGLAIKTTNAGTSWSTMTTGTTNTLWNVTFSNTTTGYLVGNSGVILKTINSGSTWTPLTTGSVADLYSVSFPTDNIGYAVGDNGTILKTTNAGSSWTPLTLGFTVSYLNSVVFLDANTGLTSGVGGIYRTTDGGATWTNVSTQDILWVTFPSATVGYGVGESGTILKTTNGGINWTILPTNTSERLWGAHFTSTDVGFAVGENGTAIKTSNGGSSWANMTTDIGTPILYAIHFGTITEGIAVGDNGTILKTIAEAPEINISAVNFKTEIPVDGSTQLSVTIPAADASRVDEVSVYVWGLRDYAAGVYTNGDIIAATGSGGIFSATVTEFDDDPLGYVYFFEITYDGYNRYTYSDYGYMYLKYETGKTLSMLNLKSGNTTSDYQIISIPLVLTTAQVGSVFEELGPADNKKWRMFSYQNGNTTQMATGAAITPGKGYWLITTTKPTIDVGVGRTVSATDADPFELTLAAGWNLIGNPYNFSITWNQGADVRELKQFNNGTYSTSSTLQPFVGYFVFADTPGNYGIPITGTFTGGRTRTNPYDQSETSWQLPITLQRGDLKNELGGIGMHQEATEGFDAFDEPALPIPTMQNMFAMIFDRPELPYALNKEIVPPTDNQVWSFVIDQPEGNEAVDMQWDPQLLTKLSNRLYLFDESNLELVDMMVTSTYKTHANAKLTILYGDEFFIKNFLAGKESRIAQPYPNPAHENLFIPVILTESGYVTVTLKDSFGRSVYQVNNYFERGHHKIEVPELTRIPVGMYLVTTEILGLKYYTKTSKLIINQNTK